MSLPPCVRVNVRLSDQFQFQFQFVYSQPIRMEAVREQDPI